MIEPTEEQKECKIFSHKFDFFSLPIQYLRLNINYMRKIDLQSVIWKEDDYYISQCLDVDVSSFGKTKEEALENLHDALELYFEDASFYPCPFPGAQIAQDSHKVVLLLNAVRAFLIGKIERKKRKSARRRITQPSLPYSFILPIFTAAHPRETGTA